ncbi:MULTISPECIES: RagB/SusD family nutrient uptake outer membrane protein [Leeuwenhoekiella]|uniref:Putative outer membrane protein, probably involved in nutrient binding n=1 Tax=Leeuwenhoekiella blandensis (strain CECT 7118 / CCUG 51940 / KCTC 22103 / MED217) TaxID=398720 RepID=A3XJ54_LEEBM|nr:MULTISPECIES: RagB/SusD family nutrient uptake outer membrane protein [Leeuwenhoekiella]EAQ50414.1 putative outer membrane protein, probably involved in nutrient binding [Leeuwenhoekiella blandensis MED217]MAO41952.1 RagB/SusD family nutrient uptake outer membrane protein [Leeuwenhoekiella sp.]HCW64890.1 RagB/SusD family nutrient uptake outer membrane protein [Leeuwenhoekiella sp.]|tara:strand:+ start:22747 stop:24225 length:1479 start_codon:yes stop_codon:yes gene_type:complete
MKKYNIQLTFLSLLAAVLMVACGDDFVEVDPINENSEDFFNSEEDYQDALVGAYDLLQATYLNVMVGEIASDNTLAGGESATDTPGIQEIDNMTHTPVNQQLRDIWGWMFAGVNRANYILEFQDKIDFSGKDQIIAQARFLRAYYYFELVKWFGDVPLAVDQRLLFGDQFNVDRTPRTEVYAQIEQDLIFAAETLPATQAEEGRITSGAARALLGKAYLYQDKFTEAASALDQVIAGPYDLVDDYSTIFELEGENNIESVFEVQYTDKEGAGFGCLQCSEGNVAVGFNGIRNYSGPLFDSGFSFNVPVQEAYDAFEPGDSRRDIAILNIEEFAAANGATYNEGYEHTGFYNRKYIARKGDANLGDANLTNPNNYRSIRFADVLLMAAEAHNRKANPNDALAREYLNRVRRRAFGDTDHDIAASGATLTDFIYDERRLELVGEGHRFFDLVRTGRAAQNIPGFTPNKNELFPIPTIEIQLAGNRWEQNQGYTN